MNNFYNRCRWFSMDNELHIDLSDLLNDTRILVLTGFNHRVGISMSIVTDDGIDRHDNPLTTLPYFPILEKLDYDGCKDFVDQIPAAVLNAAKPYSSDSFGIVIILSQNKFLTELSGNSTLFWLLFRQAKAERWNTTRFVNVCNQGESAMLIACGLPANDIALEVIAKFTAKHYAKHQYDWIKQLLTELDYQHLNAIREHIPDHLVQFLLRYPELQHAKLIKQLEQSDYNELLRIVRNLRAVAAKLEIDTVNVEKLIAESDSLAALKSHYKHLETLALKNALRDYENQLESAEASSRSFPQLSLFADRDALVQILSEAELLAESWLCQQNLMQYVPGILSGHYAIYQQLKPQRATAVYYLFPEQDSGLRQVLKCQYSADDLTKLE